METIEILIDREEVMKEVDKTTDYTGSKMQEGEDSRDRIAMTEDDMKNLSRFWDEAVAVANGRLRNMFVDTQRETSGTHRQTDTRRQTDNIHGQTDGAGRETGNNHRETDDRSASLDLHRGTANSAQGAQKAMTAEDYHVRLEVSKNFNKALVPSVKLSLMSFFIQSIVGKWFRLTNKEDAQEYFDLAGTLLEDVMQKLYSRQRPRRPRD